MTTKRERKPQATTTTSAILTELPGGDTNTFQPNIGTEAEAKAEAKAEARAEAPEVAPEAQAEAQAKAIATLEIGKRTNTLFDTEKAAMAAIRNWAERDVNNLQWVRQAARELLQDYAMSGDPLRNTANPLTYLVKAMEHRANKGGMVSKLKAWVSACSNYKWNEKSNAFALKRGMRANTSFNNDQLAAFNIDFDLYTKPKGEDKWSLDKAIKAAIRKAEGRNIPADEIAQMLKPYTTGQVPTTVNVPEGYVVKTNTAQQTQGDVAALDKDAA